MTISVKKLIILCGVTLLIIFWHHNNFTYVDKARQCDIAIRSSFFEWSNKNIIEALHALQYAYLDEYKTVCKNVKTIHPNMSCGGWEGGCFRGNPNEIYVSTAHDEFLAWTAAVIVHEACHSEQWNEGREMSEEECYERGHRTLETLVLHDGNI